MSELFGAFDQGQIPTIAFINKAKTPLGVNFIKLIDALQRYADYDIFPVWGTGCKLKISKTIPKKAWAIIFLDDADEAGALAYHDLTPNGFPLSKVFVKTTIEDEGLVSVSASHELVEMLVDPAINMMCLGPNEKDFYCYETADPVEETTYKIDGIEMSNFVYPSYFEGFRKPKSTKFDHMGLVKQPFQLLKGGYQIICTNGKWRNVFGSAEKMVRFEKEDRRGHRSESRGKVLTAAKGI